MWAWNWFKYVGRLFVSDATKFIVLVRFAIMTPPALIKLGAGSEYAETLAWLTWPHVALLTVGLAFLVLIWRAINHGYALEKNLAPRITISDPVETTLPKSGTHLLTRYVSVEIENISYGETQNCVVKEIRLTNNQNITAEITGRI